MVRSFDEEDAGRLVIDVLTNDGVYIGKDILDQSFNGIAPIMFWHEEKLISIPMSEIKKFEMYVKKGSE